MIGPTSFHLKSRMMALQQPESDLRLLKRRIQNSKTGLTRKKMAYSRSGINGSRLKSNPVFTVTITGNTIDFSPLWQ